MNVTNLFFFDKLYVFANLKTFSDFEKKTLWTLRLKI